MRLLRTSQVPTIKLFCFRQFYDHLRDFRYYNIKLEFSLHRPWSQRPTYYSSQQLSCPFPAFCAAPKSDVMNLTWCFLRTVFGAFPLRTLSRCLLLWQLKHGFSLSPIIYNPFARKNRKPLLVLAYPLSLL
jgi:hypothetical protein